MYRNTIIYKINETGEIGAYLDFLMKQNTEQEQFVLAAPYMLYLPYRLGSNTELSADQLRQLADNPGTHTHIVILLDHCYNDEMALWLSQQFVTLSKIPVMTFIVIHHTADGYHAHILVDPSYRFFYGRFAWAADVIGCIESDDGSIEIYDDSRYPEHPAITL